MKSVKKEFAEVEKITSSPEFKGKDGEIDMKKYYRELASRGLQVLFIEDKTDFKALKVFFSFYNSPKGAYHFKGKDMLILRLGKLTVNRRINSPSLALRMEGAREETESGSML